MLNLILINVFFFTFFKNIFLSKQKLSNIFFIELILLSPSIGSPIMRKGTIMFWKLKTTRTIGFDNDFMRLWHCPSSPRCRCGWGAMSGVRFYVEAILFAPLLWFGLFARVHLPRPLTDNGLISPLHPHSGLGVKCQLIEFKIPCELI